MTLVFCLALAMIPGIAAGQADSAGEYELKAAMLYNLTRFVEWPPSAYPDPQAPLLVCILGKDPFGSSLTSIVPKQTVNGRPVLIRHPQNDKGIRGCHVLYISSSERKITVQIFSILKGSSVLTVGEMSQFAAHGGMIQFSLEDQQVRFAINLDAASQAGLKISSRLLVLARIIKDPRSNSENGDSPMPSQPFHVASSWAPSGDHERSLAAGMDGYLKKPIWPQELDQILTVISICGFQCLRRSIPSSPQSVSLEIPAHKETQRLFDLAGAISRSRP